jgi:hypothetical protein
MFWFYGAVSRGIRASTRGWQLLRRQSSISPHTSCAPPTSDVPRPHGRPTEIYQAQLEALSRLWRPLESRKVELLEDGIGGNALNAIVTDLTSDIPEQGSPRVWWCYGLARDAKALDERLFQHIRHYASLCHTAHNVENQCSSVRRFLISPTAFRLSQIVHALPGREDRICIQKLQTKNPMVSFHVAYCEFDSVTD